MAVTAITWTGTPLRSRLVLTRNYRFDAKTVVPAGTYEVGAVLPGFTFNGWLGCDETSPACAGCYAKAWAKRAGYTAEGHRHLAIWGPEVATASRPAGVRVRTVDDTWAKPLRWDSIAAELGVRLRVFAFSLADVGDPHAMVRPWRRQFFELIDRTPNLLWLLLTKHPDVLVAEWPAEWRANAPPNVVVGVTGESNRWLYRRLRDLFALSARWRFVSAEPLVLRPGERMDLGPALRPVGKANLRCTRCRAWHTGAPVCAVCQNVVFDWIRAEDVAAAPGVDWVVAGGMSGGVDAGLVGELLDPADALALRDDGGLNARRWPLEIDALVDLARECEAAGVPFHTKQDAGPQPGTQGRIPDWLWARKQSLPL